MIDETITKLETFYKIATIVQVAEEEIEFCDKIDAGVMKRAAYNEILKVLKENGCVQTD